MHIGKSIFLELSAKSIFCSYQYYLTITAALRFHCYGSRKKAHWKKAHRKQAHRKKAHRKKAHTEKSARGKKRIRK